MLGQVKSRRVYQQLNEAAGAQNAYYCILETLQCRFSESFFPPDNVAMMTSAAVAKKTVSMGGIPSLLSSQPGKDDSKAGEEGENWSPASSPLNKPSGDNAALKINVFRMH